MTSKFREEDLGKIRPIPIADRDSKVTIADIIDPSTGDAATTGGAMARAFPDVLKGSDLKRLIAALHQARDAKREIVWLVGAHVVKCGLSLYLASLIEKGYITALATTGSMTIHDIELSFFGKTSEDVALELPAGRFGMVAETAAHFEAACELAAASDLGLGEGVGAYIHGAGAPNAAFSLYANAFHASVPATVHVALGTDITHQHPGFSGSRVGDLSMRDFRILAAKVGQLFDRGVVVVFGSAVVLPEVFMKAVSVAYNLGRKPEDVTAASFDMFQQYRVTENVLVRPFKGAGQSFSFSGHHELMLPLLYHLLVRD